MMRMPIPLKMRETLAADPFMRKCIVGKDCDGRIEWQHSFTYSGKRRNELWAILPMCHRHHMLEAQLRQVQRVFMVNRMFELGLEKDYRQKYPRAKLL